MKLLSIRTRVYLGVLIGVLVVGMVGFALAEGLSLLDSLYFTIVTIGTVGYGDIHPTTSVGKALAIFVIVMGVGTFLGVIANTTEAIVERREKQERLEKLNMVIGAFFSEVGTPLLKTFADADPAIGELRRACTITASWREQDFAGLQKMLGSHPYRISGHRVDLPWLKTWLSDKRGFLIGLLEHPMVHEHESFTGLLWAVFHLGDELSYREDVSALPESDLAHLTGDMERAYSLLSLHWLSYMRHLKGAYPYLFSLALRTNPFLPNPCPVVQS